MNDRRKKLVDMAFDKLDKTDDGVVTLEDLKGVYTVTSHPKYQSGEMTEDEILNTVIKKFENNTSVDGKVGFSHLYSSFEWILHFSAKCIVVRMSNCIVKYICTLIFLILNVLFYYFMVKVGVEKGS